MNINLLLGHSEDFYPTPHKLICRMYDKFKKIGKTILEPSAGKGDIVDYF